jgi:hypothetical protein
MDRRGRRAIAGAVGLLSLIGDGSVGTARLAIQGLGLDVDSVPPGATLENYRFVLTPSLRRGWRVPKRGCRRPASLNIKSGLRESLRRFTR